MAETRAPEVGNVGRTLLSVAFEVGFELVFQNSLSVIEICND
jgi:hypothetical protein